MSAVRRDCARLAAGYKFTGLLALLCLLSLPPVALGDAAGSGGLKPDLRLLIDISGSMKQSDPENLRAPALDLIVRLLPEGSRAGVWIFGENVTPLVPHGIVDAAWREAAQQAVAAIDNSGQRTNIPAALAAATYDFTRMDPSYRTSIVLLTDGKVDVSASDQANTDAARQLLDETAPRLGATGIPVHTIALSGEADWSFLEALARDSGGIAEKAESPAELTVIFLQSLEMVAPTERVPVEGSSFLIDDTVNEFTALIFFEQALSEVGLVSPTGKQYSPSSPVPGVHWFSNQQFALVTVSEPEQGEWQLLAPADATMRVTVISDLQLEVDPLPNNLPEGRNAELGLRLLEQGKVVVDPQVLALFDLSVEISGPGQQTLTLDVSGDYAVPADGEFRVTVPSFPAPGRYQVLVKLNGKTLRRELPMYVEVSATPATSPDESPLPEQPADTGTQWNWQAVLLLVAVVLVLASLWRNLKRRRLDRAQERRRQDEEADATTDVLRGVSAQSGGPEEP